MSETSDEIDRILNRLATSAPPASYADSLQSLFAADRRRDRLRESRCPVRYTRPLGGQELETEALRDVRSWWAGRGWGLVLAGGVGLGKTYAACALLLGLDVGMFGTAAELAGPDGLELLPRARRTPLLVLDELGVEARTPIGDERIQGLLGDRYAHERRTIVTTNLDLPAFRSRYGDRLVDRFRSAEGGRWNEYAGESLRRGVGL